MTSIDNKSRWQQKIQTWLPVLLWILIIVLRIPTLNKGIDYTDTGYNLAKYKYVFYGNGISDVGMFYTDLIGGIIYKLLPAYHLLVYRTLHWLLWLGTAFFSYQLFKHYVNRIVLLVAYLALDTLFGGEAIFSYYPLSRLLLFGALLLLHSGILQNSKWKIFVSGFVAGINIFVRLPNMFYLSMVLGIIWYAYCEKQEKSTALKNTMTYICGTISSLFVTLGVMTLFMGFRQMVNSIGRYGAVLIGRSGSSVQNFLGIEEKSGHSLAAEVKTIGWQGIQAIICFFGFFLIMLLIGYIFDRIFEKKATAHPYGQYITILVWCVAAVLLAPRLAGVALYVMGLYSVVGSIVFLIICRKKEPMYSTIFLWNVLLSIFSVIATDLGLQRFFIVQTMQFAVLFIIVEKMPEYTGEVFQLFRLEKLDFVKVKTVASKWTRGFSVLMCLTLFSVGIFCSYGYTYNDGTYSQLSYRFGDEIPELKGMKTTEIRAEELKQYCSIMNSAELKNKEVAVFGYFPLGLVIGPQKDYFEAVDPCVDYPRFSVEMLLQAIKEKEADGIVPVIVLSHVDRIQRNRPEDYGITSEAKQAVINYMLTLHDYEIIKMTDYFTIYVADEL